MEERVSNWLLTTAAQILLLYIVNFLFNFASVDRDFARWKYYLLSFRRQAMFPFLHLHLCLYAYLVYYACSKYCGYELGAHLNWQGYYAAAAVCAHGFLAIVGMFDLLTVMDEHQRVSISYRKLWDYFGFGFFALSSIGLHIASCDTTREYMKSKEQNLDTMNGHDGMLLAKLSSVGLLAMPTCVISFTFVGIPDNLIFYVSCVMSVVNELPHLSGYNYYQGYFMMRLMFLYVSFCVAHNLTTFYAVLYNVERRKVDPDSKFLTGINEVSKMIQDTLAVLDDSYESIQNMLDSGTHVDDSSSIVEIDRDATVASTYYIRIRLLSACVAAGLQERREASAQKSYHGDPKDRRLEDEKDEGGKGEPRDFAYASDSDSESNSAHRSDRSGSSLPTSTSSDRNCDFSSDQEKCEMPFQTAKKAVKAILYPRLPQISNICLATCLDGLFGLMEIDQIFSFVRPCNEALLTPVRFDEDVSVAIVLIMFLLLENAHNHGFLQTSLCTLKCNRADKGCCEEDEGLSGCLLEISFTFEKWVETESESGTHMADSEPSFLLTERSHELPNLPYSPVFGLISHIGKNHLRIKALNDVRKRDPETGLYHYHQSLCLPFRSARFEPFPEPSEHPCLSRGVFWYFVDTEDHIFMPKRDRVITPMLKWMVEECSMDINIVALNNLPVGQRGRKVIMILGELLDTPATCEMLRTQSDAEFVLVSSRPYIHKDLLPQTTPNPGGFQLWGSVEAKQKPSVDLPGQGGPQQGSGNEYERADNNGSVEEDDDDDSKKGGALKALGERVGLNIVADWRRYWPFSAKGCLIEVRKLMRQGMDKNVSTT